VPLDNNCLFSLLKRKSAHRKTLSLSRRRTSPSQTDSHGGLEAQVYRHFRERDEEGKSGKDRRRAFPYLLKQHVIDKVWREIDGQAIRNHFKHCRLVGAAKGTTAGVRPASVTSGGKAGRREGGREGKLRRSSSRAK
jgi:hypothetical protein